MPYLKQSTAFTFRIGPFLAVADGSVSTGLTIAQGDIMLSKAGGAFGQTSAGSPTTTHDADGWYQCPLTTTDTDTLGTLDVQVTMADNLPAFVRFEVVTAQVFNSLVAGTDKLDANAAEVGGQTQTGRDLGASVLLSVGTGAGQLNVASGKVPATVAAADVSGNVAADLQTIKARAVTDPGAGVAIGTNVAQVGSNMGSVSSVTGAVGSVTGAVGSVTGAVGSVTGSVGSVAANGITATSIAADAINAAAVKADAVTKVQTGLATPTNITAGTITTVTNLTNAPTSGDLTATMKTSVTTAATAATPTAAAVTGAVGSVTAAVTLAADQAVNVTKVNGAAADIATGAAVADLPTNAELATALAAADDATLAAVAALNNLSSAQAQSAAAAALAAYDPPTKAELDSGLAAADDAVLAVLGVAGAGLTALGDTRLANLDATVSSRSTFAGGAVASVTGNVGGNVAGSVASVTAPVTAGTVSDKTGYALTVAPPTAADVATAVWGATTRTLSGFGTLVTDIAAAVWAAAQRTLTAFGFSISATVDEGAIAEAVDTELTTNHGAGAWGGATGSGDNAVTVTVTCAGAPVIGAFVTVKNSGQTATAAGPAKTDLNGQIAFNLSDGSYKVLVGTTPAYQPLAAATLTVSGTTPLALALNATAIASPADASLCRVYAWLLTGDGQPFEGGVVKFVATDNGPETDGQLLSGATVSASSDATGYVYADLVQGASYTVTSAYYRLRGTAITVPAASTEALEDLL